MSDYVSVCRVWRTVRAHLRQGHVMSQPREARRRLHRRSSHVDSCPPACGLASSPPMHAPAPHSSPDEATRGEGGAALTPQAHVDIHGSLTAFVAELDIPFVALMRLVQHELLVDELELAHVHV